MLFTQLFINGLQTGALYALIAAGFSLIFGMTRIFHAAHGATFTIAGYIFYECYSVLHLSWPVAALAATFAASLFGVLLDRYVYAIIQRHEGSFFTVFVASFGMAIIVQNLIAMIFDRGAVTVSTRALCRPHRSSRYSLCHHIFCGAAVAAHQNQYWDRPSGAG